VKRFSIALAFAAALSFAPVAALAQGFIIGPKTQVQTPSLAPQGNPPTGTGCTIANNSTDMAGSCTTTATSGTIVFATALASAPNCILVDATSAATVPQVTYTTTATQITLTTVTSAHVLRWVCFPGAAF